MGPVVAGTWARWRPRLLIACVVLTAAAAVLLLLADYHDVVAVGVSVLLVLVLLSATLVVTGVMWASAGRSPTPGVLVALGGTVLLPAALLGVSFGSSGLSLGALGLAGAWVVAGLVAAARPGPVHGRYPVARPARLETAPWWAFARVGSLAALGVLIVVVGYYASESFSMFPSKETPEDMVDIRRAAAMQWRVMVVGAIPLVVFWWYSLRRKAAAIVLVGAAFVGSLWSILGFAASLPLFLTAVVLVFLPARRLEAAPAPQHATQD